MSDEEHKDAVRESRTTARIGIRRWLRILRLVPKFLNKVLNGMADDVTQEWLAADLLEQDEDDDEN